MIEGACVYSDINNFSSLLMYKEINNKIILYVKYNFIEFSINFVNIYDFEKIFPYENIHILNNLPYDKNLEITLNVWRNIALDRLNFLNKNI